jgi:hypothetical protein
VKGDALDQAGQVFQRRCGLNRRVAHEVDQTAKLRRRRMREPYGRGYCARAGLCTWWHGQAPLRSGSCEAGILSPVENDALQRFPGVRTAIAFTNPKSQGMPEAGQRSAQRSATGAAGGR